MKDLSYEAYVSDPAIHEQIEIEVRRMRAEAVRACLCALFRTIFRRASADVLKLETA